MAVLPPVPLMLIVCTAVWFAVLVLSSMMENAVLFAAAESAENTAKSPAVNGDGTANVAALDVVWHPVLPSVTMHWY
jgi:hypothetical protein